MAECQLSMGRGLRIVPGGFVFSLVNVVLEVWLVLPVLFSFFPVSSESLSAVIIASDENVYLLSAYYVLSATFSAPHVLLHLHITTLCYSTHIL